MIRKPTKEDMAAYSDVIVSSWEDHLGNLVPDEHINSLKENKQNIINYNIEHFDEHNNHKLVLEVNQKIVGIASYDPDHCEIKALYLLKEYSNQGLGKQLFKNALLELKNLGCTQVTVGCLEVNPANKFYQKMGGQLIGQRRFVRTTIDLPENLYKFDLR